MKRLKELIFGNDHPFVRNILSSLSFFAALTLIDLSFRYIYSYNDPQTVAPWVPTSLTVFWCLILCSVSLLLPKTVRRIYNISITSVYAILCLIHAFFHSFFGTYMSFSSVIFAGEGASFFDWTYFDISKKLVVMLVFCIFLSVFSALILPKTKYHIVKIIAILLIVVLSVFAINSIKKKAFSDEGGITWENKPGVDDTYDTFTDTYACFHMTGLYHYTFRDISITTGLNDRLGNLFNSHTLNELDEYYENREISPDNEMTGIFKDKNLILIQLESIDTWMLNETAMPNLTKIRSESIDFTAFYAPKYLWGATFNTENIVNTGTISPVNSSRVTYFTETYYPYSAANLFSKAGYITKSFHRSNGNIYNRAAAHINWGYTEYNSGPGLNLSDYDLDSSFIEVYDQFVSDEKFMTFFITYTGHGPFSKDQKAPALYYDMMAKKLPDDAAEEYICALCSAWETDLFVGKLFEKLEDDGHIDDTVVVFYSDHYNHYLTDSELLAELKGTSDTNLMCNIPFFIYSKDVEAMKVDKVVASYDVLPTIANMFDLDTDGRYYFGDDAFSDNGGYVIFPDRSWYDGEVYFKVYESETTELSTERAAEISKRLKMNWNTVKTNYFKIREAQ